MEESPRAPSREPQFAPARPRRTKPRPSLAAEALACRRHTLGRLSPPPAIRVRAWHVSWQQVHRGSGAACECVCVCGRSIQESPRHDANAVEKHRPRRGGRSAEGEVRGGGVVRPGSQGWLGGSAQGRSCDGGVRGARGVVPRESRGIRSTDGEEGQGGGGRSAGKPNVEGFGVYSKWGKSE